MIPHLPQTLCLSLMFVLVCGSLQAETLQEMLDLGVKQGRTAGLHRAELHKQQAVLGAAKAGFKPKFTVSSDTTDRRSYSVQEQLATATSLSGTLTEDGDGGKFEQLTLSQSLFVHNAIELARARARWAIAQIQYEQSMEDFKFEVIRKFYEVLRSEERVKTLQESVDRWSTSLKFAEVKFELGATNKIDVLNTQVNQAQARTGLLEEQQALQRRLDELKDLIGVPMTRPVTLQESLEFTRLETVPVDWVRREVRIARFEKRLAEANLEDADARSKPDVRLDATYRSNQNSTLVLGNQIINTGNEEIIGAVTYNFQLGRRAEDFRMDQLQQDLITANLRLTDQELEVQREQRDIFRSLALKEQAILTSREAHDQARESYSFSLDAFQKGIISSLDLRDSQEKLTRARDIYTGLLIDYKIESYRYVKVMGGTL